MTELIKKDVLSEEIESLTVHVTGLRAGKGVLSKFMDEYRNSVLRVIDEQLTTTEAEIRAKAIDEFIKRLYKIGEYREFDWEDIYKLADEMKAEQLKSSGNSEQLNGLFETNKWIPVEERLPEDCGDVICTVYLKGYEQMNSLALWYNAKSKKWHYTDEKEVDSNIVVVAWRPLPEPYVSREVTKPSSDSDELDKKGE